MVNGKLKIKKYHWAVILLLLPAFAFAQPGNTITDGPQKFYYPGGKVSSEGNFVNGLPEGVWKSYYTDGILKSEGNRLNGQLEGTWTFYAENGVKASEYNYIKGIENGWEKQYYPDGTLASERWKKNGIADSISKIYSDKGYLQKIIPLKDGAENGVAREFAEDGKIITVTTYRNGFFVKEEKINRVDKFGFKQGMWKLFYDDGSTKEDGSWKDDKKNGVFRWYTQEGVLNRMEIWKNDELVPDEAVNVKLDIKRDYYNNGRPKSSVNLINGVKEGVYRDYDNLGTITGSKLYDKDRVIAEGGIVDANGQQQGEWKYFYSDGKVKSKGFFKDGKRDGQWTFYYLNQKVQQTGSYKDNQPIGNWKWYYANEQILREENYKNGKEDGASAEYDEGGNEIAKGNYAGGKKEGAWKLKNGEYIAE